METLALSVLVTTVIAGTVVHLRHDDRRFVAPKATLAIAAVTLITSTVGNLDADVLQLFDRNRVQLLDGEWWRLVTPLFLQDGGWPGTVSNLVSLIMIGLCAETLYRRTTFLAVYFLAGVISEVFAYTLMQHQGFAGNSVANAGTAGLCVVLLGTATPVLARLIGAIGVLSGAFLTAAGNLHGVGFAVGALAAVALSLRPRPSTGPVNRQFLHGPGVRSRWESR